MKEMTFFEELKWRGLVKDVAGEDIADKLCISSFTLKKHLQNIYRKFDVNSRWTLIQKCIHHEK